MAEPSLSMYADDDLPRTIRRERDAKEAREREARERDARERLSTEPAPIFEHPAAYERPMPRGFAPSASAAAAALDMPFSRLVAFFVKAAFAAIPALIIFMGLLWLLGHGLQVFFPDLVKLKILIYMPK